MERARNLRNVKHPGCTAEPIGTDPRIQVHWRFNDLRDCATGAVFPWSFRVIANLFGSTKSLSHSPIWSHDCRREMGPLPGLRCTEEPRRFHQNQNWTFLNWVNTNNKHGGAFFSDWKLNKNIITNPKDLGQEYLRRLIVLSYFLCRCWFQWLKVDLGCDWQSSRKLCRSEVYKSLWSWQRKDKTFSIGKRHFNMWFKWIIKIIGNQQNYQL